MKKIINSAWTSVALIASYVVPVFAADAPIDFKGQAPAGLTDLTVPRIVTGFISLAVVAAAVIFFLWLILGGIQWMLSGGDKQKTEAARGQITGALVGLVIVFSAWAIAQLFQTLFGVNIFGLQIKSF